MRRSGVDATVLCGETVANFFTKRRVGTWQVHHTEDVFEPGAWVMRRGRAPFEHVVRVFTDDDHVVPAICRFTRFAELRRNSVSAVFIEIRLSD